MSAGTPDAIVAAVRSLSRFEVRAIDEFRATMTRTVRRWRQGTQAEIDALQGSGRRPRLGEMIGLEEDLEYCSAVQELADRSAINMLYMSFEIRVKQLISIGIPGTMPHTLFRWHEVQRSLTRVGLCPSNMPGYADVNELRTLNNAIKHEGRVSQELARFGYALGQPIPDLSGTYERFEIGCGHFIRATSEGIVRYHDPSGQIVNDLETQSDFFGAKIEI